MGDTAEDMYVFVSVDPQDQSEQMMGMRSGTGWQPLVSLDYASLDQMRSIARFAADGREVRLIHFSKREVLPAS